MLCCIFLFVIVEEWTNGVRVVTIYWIYLASVL